ncbi:MAG: AI-2E family transporter [Coriobacteriia bacterium]|nr:AI-2E family transporter [Coriobacteriia bacterium]
MVDTETRNRAARVAIVSWATIGMAILLIGVGWLLACLSPALTPFIMAGLLALILRGPVHRLEQRGMHRAAAVGVCYLAMVFVLAGLLAFVIPLIGHEIVQFIRDFPKYYAAVESWWIQVQGNVETLVLPGWAAKALEDAFNVVVGQLGKWGSAIASGVLSTGGAVANFLFNLIFALVIGFWVLKDLPAIRNEVMELIGDKRRAEAEMVISTVLRVLGGYVRGQLIVSAVTGSLVATGLAVLGVPYAFLLGLLTGVLNVVPYMGPLVGGLTSAIVAAFIGPWTAAAALAITFAAQQVTDLFVTPRVMSSQVDLHPLLVIFSLLVGGTLAGFWGLIVAIPVAAITKGLFVYYFEKHTRRPLGSESGALFKKAPRPPESGSTDAAVGRDCDGVACDSDGTTGDRETE